MTLAEQTVDTAHLGLSRLHFPVTTLGPGKRLGIWFQGCSIRCPGCISADTWRAPQERIAAPDLVAQIAPWLAACDGVTISGGEPFDQPEALHALLQCLRAERDTNVLVYSGHPWEALQPHLGQMSGLIDALISEPFVQEAPHTLALRGSDNQRLHCLTPRGQALFAGYERAHADGQRHFDLMLDAQGTVWLAGIPGRGDMQRLQALLQADGHRAHTTEAPDRNLCTTPR